MIQDKTYPNFTSQDEFDTPEVPEDEDTEKTEQEKIGSDDEGEEEETSDI